MDGWRRYCVMKSRTLSAAINPESGFFAWAGASRKTNPNVMDTLKSNSFHKHGRDGGE